MSHVTRTAALAKYDVTATRESDALAMSVLESEVTPLGVPMLSAMLSEIHALTNDADVESVAVLTVARLLAGDSSRTVGRAARAGVRQARAMVNAHRTGEHVDSEAVVTMADRGRTADDQRASGGGLSAITAPAADKAWNVTPRDLVRAMRHALDDSPHGAIWRDATGAYMALTTGETGRPVSLAGVLAHTRGLTKDDSEYWTLRRLTVAALAAALPRLDALRAAYAAHTHAPRVRAPWTVETLEACLSAAARADAIEARAYASAREAVAPIPASVQYVETVMVERVRETAAKAPTAVDVDALLTGQNTLSRDAMRPVWNGARREWTASLFDARTLVDVERAFTRRAPLTFSGVPASRVEYVESVPAVRVERAAPLALSPVTGLPMVDVVTVRTADGETYAREMSDVEREAMTVTREREARYDGEAYGESAHRANVPGLDGAVRSGKAPVSPRRKAGGATGATVPASPSRD